MYVKNKFSIRTKIIVTIILVLYSIMYAIEFTKPTPQKIKLSDYTTIKFAGVSGEGRLESVSINLPDKFKDLKEINKIDTDEIEIYNIEHKKIRNSKLKNNQEIIVKILYDNKNSEYEIDNVINVKVTGLLIKEDGSINKDSKESEGVLKDKIEKKSKHPNNKKKKSKIKRKKYKIEAGIIIENISISYDDAKYDSYLDYIVKLNTGEKVIFGYDVPKGYMLGYEKDDSIICEYNDFLYMQHNNKEYKMYFCNNK